MLEILTVVFQTLTAWCPRFTKVPPTDRLVKWSNCREGTLHGPGRIWYWPLVTEVENVDIRWRSCVMHVQSLTLADGTSVSARALTRWKTVEVLQCIEDYEDIADTVGETAQSCVVDVLSSMNVEHLKCVGALNVALELENRKQLAECGVGVGLCKFTELVVSPAYRLINDAG